MNIFYNPIQGRVRAGWRLILQGAFFLIGALLSGLLLDLADLPAASKALFLVCVLLSCWLATRFLDHRPFLDLGFHFSRAWWRDLGFGLALGAVLMLGIFLAEYAAGWITVTRVLVDRARAALLADIVIGGAIGYIFVGIYEEMCFRGYQMRNLAEGLHWRFVSPRAALLLAYVLSSMLFGSLHQGNSNSTPLTTPLLALAGLFMGLGYLLTGELAIPIGLHITWNFFQGHVFGFPVSGAGHGGSLIGIRQGGPIAWTGGAWGPEGGLVGLLALVAGSLLIVAWVRLTRGKIRPEDRLAVYARPSAAGTSSHVQSPAAIEPGQTNICAIGPAGVRASSSFSRGPCVRPLSFPAGGWRRPPAGRVRGQTHPRASS